MFENWIYNMKDLSVLPNYYNFQIDCMENSCRKCNEKSLSSLTLSCEHNICSRCLNLSCRTACTCPICFVMTPLQSQDNEEFPDPQTNLVCLQCRGSVFSMRQFLEGKHRSHQIVSVSKMIPEIQKKLRKYQLSLELQNQSLFREIQERAQEKRILSEAYSTNIFKIREIFSKLKNQIKCKEQELAVSYEKIILQKVQKIDEIIREIRSKIKRSESYSSSIESHLLQSGRNRPIQCSQFLLSFEQIFHNFASKLADHRLGQKIIIPKMPTIIEKNYLEMSEIVKKISLWEENRSTSEGSICTNNFIEQYFETKRKQIFDKSSEDSSPTESSWKFPQKSKREKKLNSSGTRPFDIEDRIQNLRRTLRIGD